MPSPLVRILKPTSTWKYSKINQVSARNLKRIKKKPKSYKTLRNYQDLDFLHIRSLHGNLEYQSESYVFCLLLPAVPIIIRASNGTHPATNGGRSMTRLKEDHL